MSTKMNLPEHSGVQDICKKLKQQLDTLSDTIVDDGGMTQEEKARRKDLMEKLKKQLSDLSL